LVVGSNTFVFGNPRSLSRCPPATSRRPSGRKSWPAQNSSEGAGIAVKLPVAGSHTCVSPSKPKLSTLPVGSRLRCTSTNGAGNTADQRPNTASGGGSPDVVVPVATFDNPPKTAS